MTDERHPDHERVKARLERARTAHYGSMTPAMRGELFDAIAAEAIAMGARAPDPIQPIVDQVRAWIGCDTGRAREIVNYILDNAPKEG